VDHDSTDAQRLRLAFPRLHCLVAIDQQGDLTRVGLNQLDPWVLRLGFQFHVAVTSTSAGLGYGL
jgi:hypothetical protein